MAGLLTLRRIQKALLQGQHLKQTNPLEVGIYVRTYYNKKGTYPYFPCRTGGLCTSTPKAPATNDPVTDAARARQATEQNYRPDNSAICCSFKYCERN